MQVVDGNIGTTYIVEKINLDEVVERRLEILGMTEGVKISILNKKNGGAVILRVRGSRFALGREIAEGIRIGCVKNE